VKTAVTGKSHTFPMLLCERVTGISYGLYIPTLSVEARNATAAKRRMESISAERLIMLLLGSYAKSFFRAMGQHK
jgi:hypothetical protein